MDSAAPSPHRNRRQSTLHRHGSRNRPFLVIILASRGGSRAMFTLWDDCMSFPWMLVKVRRHASITVKFQDSDGKISRVGFAWGGRSRNMFQHEDDHL